VLIEHLPPESATMTAIRNANPHVVTEDGPDPAEGRWSQTEMLLAAAVDDLRFFRWAYLCAKSGKGSKPKQPEPIRRPGVEKKRKKADLTPAQYDWLFRHINGIASEEDEFTEVNIAPAPLTNPEP
jgi:hypothetical protein